MAWIDGKALWFFAPALTDVFVGGEAFESFESLGKIVSQLEGVEMCLQVLMGLIVVLPHRRSLERTVHAFDLAIGPGLVGFGEPMGHAMLLTDAIEDMVEGILIARTVSELDAVIGQHGVELV